MKYYSAFIFLMCLVTVFGQTYYSLGEIIPGQSVLGIAYNVSTVTWTPEKHSVKLHFQAAPGSVITFVHINMYPDWGSMGYSGGIIQKQFDDMDLEVNARTETTVMGVNIIVFGFSGATSTGRNFKKATTEREDMVIIKNNEQFNPLYQ